MEVITYPETYISCFIHTYKKLLAELRESYKDNERLENKSKSYVDKKIYQICIHEIEREKRMKSLKQSGW